MLQAFTAFTLDPDDQEQAVREVLDQLDLEKNLKKNAVGLLHAYLDFFENGVVEALCKALPFPVLGCTTPGTMTENEMDQVMLSLVVLTSDDVAFASGVTTGFEKDAVGSLERLYGELSANAAQKPALIIGYQPMEVGISGNKVTQLIDKLSGGVPFFGNISLDMETDMRKPYTMYNGVQYGEEMTLLTITGEVHPRFLIESLPPERILNQNAVITKADENTMLEINGLPARTYMEEKLGLRFDGSQLGLPIAINYHDGTKPKTCSFYATTTGGGIVCAVETPVGATLAVGSLNYDDVISTAKKLVNEAKEIPDWSVMLLFSCFSRNMVLADTMAEMNAVRDEMRDEKRPFIMIYSGGEICPLYNDKGVPVNGFHNYSLIACLI